MLAPDVTEISGWVLSHGAPVSRVEVWTAAGKCLHANIGFPRPDVVQHFGRYRDAELSGFRVLLDVADHAAGDVLQLIVVVVLLDGAEGILSVVNRPVRRRVPPPEVVAPREAPAQRRTRRTRRRPTVLVVTHSLQTGGAELQLLDLVRHLRRARWRVHVVAPSDGPHRSLLEEQGAAVALLPGTGVRDPEAWERRQDELLRHARKTSADVVLVNTLAGFSGVSAAVRAGLPVLWDVHETMPLKHFLHAGFPFESAVHPAVAEQARAAVRDADVIVVEAAASAAVLRDLRGDRPLSIVAPGVRAMPGGVGRAAARAAVGFAERQQVVLCVGSLQVRKGQGLLAQAVPHLVDRHPELVCALVGDSGGDYSAAVRRYVARAGLEDRVVFVPPTRDVAVWYSAADVLCCPSQNETLPGVVLEAMTMRLPVVASAVAAVPEAVVDRSSGWLCRPDDLGSLIGNLSLALTVTGSEREAIVGNAYEYARREQSRSARLRAMRRLLEDLGGGVVHPLVDAAER